MVRYYFNNVNGNIEIKKANNSIHSSKTHFHNEISLGVVEEGNCRTEIDGNIYELKEKTMLIIPPELVHTCNPDDYMHWKFTMLYINKDWFETAFNYQAFKIEFSYSKVDEKMFRSINSLFKDLGDKIMNIENESKILEYISFLTNLKDKSLEKEKLELLKSDKIKEVKKYLDENYLKNVMLSDLVKVAELSKYYLIRQFEEYYGLSPHKYLTNLRINHSKKLLKNHGEFVDIALASGFYDQSHFIKAFKDYTGVTPMKYKSCS